MRWDALRYDQPGQDGSGSGQAAPALFERGAVTRTFDTPGFRGMTFFEVHARSLINRVPDASRVPFHWTINPYRGCSHACAYCFARKSHVYLDLDSGHDFDSKIVVKVNAPERVRKELGSARWRGEPIAMGTNVDCYQRAEGRYRLMPGILTALRDYANPFSILTKGTLILRDIDLLEQAADVTDVGLAFSVGCTDLDLWRTLEPGTPSPLRRLEACATLTDRGLPPAVLMGPVVPFLSDSPAQLDATVRQAAQAGATSVTPIVLHLRTGAREWFFAWLGEHHPSLVPRYRAMYGRGAYAPKDYQQRVAGQVRELAQRYRVGQLRAGRARVGQKRASQNRAEPNQTEPSRAGPERAGPERAEREGASQVGADGREPARRPGRWAGRPAEEPTAEAARDGSPPVQLALL
jgi:DNA repair photolyase